MSHPPTHPQVVSNAHPERITWYIPGTRKKRFVFDSQLWKKRELDALNAKRSLLIGRRKGA